MTGKQDQGRTKAAAEAMEDAAMRWLGRDLGTIHRNDIADEALAAVDRWDRQHGYVRTTAELIAAALVDPLTDMQRGHFVGETARSNAAGWADHIADRVVAVLRAAGEDQANG